VNVLGHDVAGVITKTGSKVSRFKVGDEVYARPADHRIGTFAELIAMNEAALTYVEGGRAKGKVVIKVNQE